MFDQLMNALTHPHKLKIIMALYEREALTAQDIKAIAPEIPHASLYRHLNALEKDDLIKVVKREKVRSMVEKTYALHLPLDDGLQHQLSNRDGEGLFQLFYGFMLPLLSRFYRYSKQESIDLMHDPMSFKSQKIKGSPQELKRLSKQIQDLIEPHRAAEDDKDTQTVAVIITPPISS